MNLRQKALNKEVVPNIEKWEEEQRIPRHLFEDGRNGLFGS